MQNTRTPEAPAVRAAPWVPRRRRNCAYQQLRVSGEGGIRTPDGRNRPAGRPAWRSEPMRSWCRSFTAGEMRSPTSALATRSIPATLPTQKLCTWQYRSGWKSGPWRPCGRFTPSPAARP